MALVGDKVKLTNYKYKLSADASQILTKESSDRNDLEKVVDAFDIDWRPYTLTYYAKEDSLHSYSLSHTYELIGWLNAAYSYTLYHATNQGHYPVEHVSQGITYTNGLVVTSVEADDNGHLYNYTTTTISNSNTYSLNVDPDVRKNNYFRNITNVNLLSNLELAYTYHDIYFPIDGTDGNASQDDKVDRLTGTHNQEFISGIKRLEDGTISYTYEKIGTTFTTLINDATDDYEVSPYTMSYTFNTNRTYFLSYACIKQDGTGSYSLSTEVSTGIEKSVALDKYILTIAVEHGELMFDCYRSMEIMQIELSNNSNIWRAKEQEDEDEFFGITTESGKNTVISKFKNVLPVESQSSISLNKESITIYGGPSEAMAMFWNSSENPTLTYTCRDYSTDYNSEGWTTNPIYQFAHTGSVSDLTTTDYDKSITLGGSNFTAQKSSWVDFYVMGQDAKQVITNSWTAKKMRLVWMLKVYYGLNENYASEGNNESQFIQYNTSNIYQYNKNEFITFTISSNNYYVFVPHELTNSRDLKFTWNGGVYGCPSDGIYYLTTSSSSIQYDRYFLGDGVTPDVSEEVILQGYFAV